MRGGSNAASFLLYYIKALAVNPAREQLTLFLLQICMKCVIIILYCYIIFTQISCFNSMIKNYEKPTKEESP